jgi:hypothetical protein
MIGEKHMPTNNADETKNSIATNVNFLNNA